MPGDEHTLSPTERKLSLFHGMPLDWRGKYWNAGKEVTKEDVPAIEQYMRRLEMEAAAKDRAVEAKNRMGDGKRRAERQDNGDGK